MSATIVARDNHGIDFVVQPVWAGRLRANQANPIAHAYVHAQRFIDRSNQLTRRRHRAYCKRRLANGATLWSLPSLESVVRSRFITAVLGAAVLRPGLPPLFVDSQIRSQLQYSSTPLLPA